MKVSLIGHAAILVEVGGVTVLSDPWWRGPCFGAQWWIYPRPRIDLLDARPLDFIYVSHGHHDHFHPGTLQSLPKTAKVLVSASSDLAVPIRALGFEVIEVPEDRPVDLGGAVQCRIMSTYGDDTLMTLTNGKEVCVNANDALHSAPAEVQERFAAKLRELHPTIDYLFCGYGIASHFPNCYALPGKDREASTAHRQKHFNGEWVKLTAKIGPRFSLPFAADVVFLDHDLFWVNEVTHNSQRPTDLFRERHPSSSTTVIDPAPGFVIEGGRVTTNALRVPVSAAALRADYAEEIARANRYGSVDPAEVGQVAELLRQNLEACRAYLASFPHDYRVLIRFHGSSAGLMFEKNGSALSVVEAPDASAGCDLVYTTRLAYMRWALTREHGHEILFVGSGGIFEYLSDAVVPKGIHQEVIALVRKANRAPRASRGYVGRALAAAKGGVKGLLRGKPSVDLYDLPTWTILQR